MKPQLTAITSIILFFSSCSHAEEDFTLKIKSLDQEYLVCNNRYNNTGSTTNYKSCLDNHYKNYDELVKTIRDSKGFNQKNNWSIINNNILDHSELCRNNSVKTANSFKFMEVSYCNHFMYKALATEALLLRGK